MADSISAPRPALETRVTIGAVALLTLLIMLAQMSTSLYVPSLPALTDVFATDAAAVNMTMTSFLVAFAFAQLCYGPVSDRFGRRPVLLFGIAVYLLATIACAFAPSVEVLTVGRFFQGLGACAGPAMSRAIVRDRYDRAASTKVMAFVGMALSVGPAIGPLVGGLLHVTFGWRAGFAALVAFGIAVLVAVVTRLPESLRNADARATAPLQLARTYATLLTSRVFVGHMILIASLFGGLYTFVTGIPYVLIELLGMSPAVFGIVAAVPVLGNLVGSLYASRAAGRVPGEAMIARGVAISLLGAGVVLVPTLFGFLSAAALIAPLTVVMLGFGIAVPSSFAGAMHPFPAMAGAASAVLGFSQMALASVATVLVGVLYDGTAVPMASVLFVMIAVAAIAQFALIRPHDAS